MENESTQKIIRPCGCDQANCSFGACVGIGEMAILENIPGGYEIKKRVKSVEPQCDGSFLVKWFCHKNGWIDEIMPQGAIKAVVAP